MTLGTSELTVQSIRRVILSGEATAEEICRRHLERIEESDQRVRAFITVTPERALHQARLVDQRVSRGEEPGALAGVPVAIKDILVTRGVRTTCGSRVLSNFIPPYSATVVERLEKEGAVILGKTNMDEFAMGSSTENSAFFPTHNPWDLDRVPGGSSGGSAAAVAAAQVVVALGSDTGGSVRQPAGFCGIVGLKPTYGLVSRFGLVAFASSLDHVGLLARGVEDCARVLEVIAGPDPKDSTCSPDSHGAYTSNEARADVKVGIIPESLVDRLEPGARAVYLANVQTLREIGAQVGEATLPHWDASLPAYYILCTSEASSNLARYDGVKYGLRADAFDGLRDMYSKTRAEGFGAEVKRRIILGTYSLSSGYYDAYYLQACRVRTLVLRDFARNFERFDVLAMPTTPGPAFRLGEKLDDPIQMYLSDVFTVTANLAGVPAISVPSGFVGGLPVGLQIVGPHFAEERVLQFARAFEKAVGVSGKLPRLSAACQN